MLGNQWTSNNSSRRGKGHKDPGNSGSEGTAAMIQVLMPLASMATVIEQHKMLAPSLSLTVTASEQRAFGALCSHWRKETADTHVGHITKIVFYHLP